MSEKRRIAAPDGAGRRLHWWHLAAVLGLVAAVECGRELLRGTGTQELLTTLPSSLYVWCPILAGVAISIRRSDRRSSGSALRVGLVVVLFMVALDVLTGISTPPPDFTTALTPEGTLERRTTGEVGRSWVLTAIDWSRGALEGTGERLVAGRQGYPGIHPRAQAGDALQDGSLIFLVFGILGLVIAIGRWIRTHATFHRRGDERAAHLVVAWLLCPLVVGIVEAASGRLFHAALFRDGPLWAIPLPSVALLATGVFVWIRAARHVHTHEVPGADGP